MNPTETALSLIQQIKDLQAKYHEAVSGDVIHRKVADGLTADLKTVRKQLEELLTKGASPCKRPECVAKKAVLCGMLRREAHEREGVEYPAIFELGCLSCPRRVTSYDVNRLAPLWEKINT